VKSIHWLTTLSRFKQHLNKTSTTNDEYIESLISVASSDIENYTGRKLRVRTYGANGLDAEIKNGTGTNKIYVDNYPITSVTSIHDDNERSFDAGTLKTAAEYMIWKDEGIIQLYSDAVNGSKFSTGIANIQIIYTAGYGNIEIISGVNDKLQFADDGGSYIPVITPGVYTPTGLATEIATQMNALTSETDHIVTYDDEASKFIFASGGSSVFTLVWVAVGVTGRGINRTIGFASASLSGAATYTADFSVIGIPADLEMACIQLVNRYYKEGSMGSDRFDVSMKTNSAGGGSSNVMYVQDDMPKNVRRILESYKKPSGGIS